MAGGADHKSLFSSQWHRVADLKPRLRRHAKFSRQTFGGQVWHMLHDPATGRSHRLSQAVYSFVARMDGERTMEELWLRTSEQMGDDCPSQDDCIQILSQLHSADVLICHLPPDVSELTTRGQDYRRRQSLAKFRNPLGIRLPLFDPDRFLERTLPFVRPIYSAPGLILWLLVVGYGLSLAAMNWSAFTSDFSDRVLAADNLLVLWFTFPLIKAIHELSHGYAVKRWGGEVHEMGLMFLIFVPVPYVDATASAEFREKWKRAFVGAAGILAELPIAAIAMVVWVNAEPGLIRAIAYNAVLISSVSTVLFNGNPLLRYDGYYTLTDIIEMPNLAQRAHKYIGYLIQRYVFRIEKAVSPADHPDERWKLALFSVASFSYRLMVWTGIILLVATKFFMIGVALSIWAAWQMVGWPIVKMIGFLFRSPVLFGRRMRALGVTTGVLLALAFVAFVIPAPLATITEGVVWTPEKTEIRAGRSGVIREVFANPGETVSEGAMLLSIEDPIVVAEAHVAELRYRESEIKFNAARAEDPYAASLFRAELEALQSQVESAQRKVEQLVAASGSDGELIINTAEDLPGKYVRRGDLVGYVKGDEGVIIKSVIPEKEIALVRERRRGAAIRLASRPQRAYEASIVRIAPSASREAPHLALTKQGGGKFSLDPGARQPDMVLEDIYYMELKSSALDDESLIGGRVYIRIDLGMEPIGVQFFRRARQVFLERLNV